MEVSPEAHIPLTARLRLEPVRAVRSVRGIPIDSAVRLTQILVTGPPGAGKTTFIQGLGGWPEEGYIDLSLKGWWRARSLSLRPREVHLGFPFAGRPKALTLFHEDWLAHWQELELDESRILVPPPVRHLFSVDWRSRYVFDFILPAPAVLLRHCEQRAARGTHFIDRDLDPQRVRRQLELYTRAALCLHRQGMTVFIRGAPSAPPARIADSISERDHG